MRTPQTSICQDVFPWLLTARRVVNGAKWKTDALNKDTWELFIKYISHLQEFSKPSMYLNALRISNSKNLAEFQMFLTTEFIPPALGNGVLNHSQKCLRHTHGSSCSSAWQTDHQGQSRNFSRS